MWGKLINRATSFQFLSMPDTELPNCVFTPTRTKSPRAAAWRWLLLITTWKAFLRPVFILFPRSDTHQIQGITKPQFDLSQSRFSAETWHCPCLRLQAQPQRPNINLVFVHTPPPVPGEEPSDCPVHSVQLLPPLPFWELHRGICNTCTCTNTKDFHTRFLNSSFLLMYQYDENHKLRLKGNKILGASGHVLHDSSLNSQVPFTFSNISSLSW